MTPVFVDAFFWIALLNKLDASHNRVRNATRPKQLVTTVAVLLEVMDALSSVSMRRTAMRFWQRSFLNPRLEIVSLDKDLMDQAASLFGSRLDKAWSLTDCISFTTMSDRGITLALTGDHHYKQAGFEIAFP